MFIINHEASEAETRVRFADLGFRVAQIVDIESGKSIAFKLQSNAGEFSITVPFGTTRLLKMLPKTL